MAKVAKMPAPPKPKSADKPRSKSEVYANLAEMTELSKKQVSAVFEGMAALIQRDLKAGQVFSVPGLMKITVIKRPATKAREGINPFTKEKIMIKAKPARKVVKVRPLKNLKEMVM